LLGLSVSGVAALAGCQSILPGEPESDITLTVTNATDENHEVWIQITGKDDDIDDQLGEELLLEGKTSDVVDVTVPQAEYTLTVSVNDINPVLERAVTWSVTDKSCSTRGSATVVPGDEDPSLVLDASVCD
jgi:hypothetical protein